MPLGINVVNGTALYIDEQQFIKGNIVECFNYGCLAYTLLDEDEMIKLINYNEPRIGLIVALSNKQINIQFSTRGLQEGLKQIKNY